MNHKCSNIHIYNGEMEYQITDPTSQKQFFLKRERKKEGKKEARIKTTTKQNKKQYIYIKHEKWRNVVKKIKIKI